MPLLAGRPLGPFTAARPRAEGLTHTARTHRLRASRKAGRPREVGRRLSRSANLQALAIRIAGFAMDVPSFSQAFAMVLQSLQALTEMRISELDQTTLSRSSRRSVRGRLPTVHRMRSGEMGEWLPEDGSGGRDDGTGFLLYGDVPHPAHPAMPRSRGQARRLRARATPTVRPSAWRAGDKLFGWMASPL